MKNTRWMLTGTVLFLLLLVAGMAVQAADDRPSQAPGQRHSYPPVGLYLDLTEEFNRAMQSDGAGGNRTLSTNLSEDYLHQIAVATRYTVETNLQILKQQERIIQLLEKNAGKTP
ncbi:MAG: hypothetical protein HZB87_09425 [Desulfatitalea sp.]|nr:hypothetical protein [Desulfatitalea sp.]